MKTIKRALSVIIMLAVLAPACACAEGGRGILYRVTGGKNDMYLLGSIHIGSEAMYPMSGAITDALDNADVLVMECDTESGAVVGRMMSMMSYPVGETLKDNISPELWELLSEAAKLTDYPAEMLNAFRPWAVTSMLAVESTAAEMGVDDVTEAMSWGVESRLAQMAADKPREYLETAEAQLAVMDGFSPELQEYMLYSTCMSILHPGEYVQAGDEGLKSWPEWWSRGEADMFADSYLVGFEQDPYPELMAEYHSELITKRNAVMANGLRDMLEGAEQKSYFAVVGLLHLVLPDDSVVSLLTDMGYTVERVM